MQEFLVLRVHDMCMIWLLRLPSLCAGAAAFNTGPVGATSSVDSSDGRPRVCILGGGFGGLYTAIKLELLMWPRGKKPKARAARPTHRSMVWRWALFLTVASFCWTRLVLLLNHISCGLVDASQQGCGFTGLACGAGQVKQTRRTPTLSRSVHRQLMAS
jgi:hypothetical protein